MIWVLALLTVSGVNGTFWILVGVFRFLSESLTSFLGHTSQTASGAFTTAPYFPHGRVFASPVSERWTAAIPRTRIAKNEVAVMIPAHNEELTIGHTITSLSPQLSPGQIYVGSDASTDRTVEIARSLGCQVVAIQPNRGKAGVLEYLLREFRLLDRYKVVMVLDADSEVSSEYFEKGLPLFDDPRVAAVAGHAITEWQSHWPPRWSMFFIAYRVRIWRLLQAILRYGQTWRYTNVTFIVPGFASMYRTSALRHINVNPGGLVIEDYHMTFELHHKRLGKVAYHPQVYGTTRDPHRFGDYVRQVRRWNLGFWQTVRRHKIWPSFFWCSLGAYLAELFIYSFFLLLAVPLAVIWFFTHSFAPIPISLANGPFSYQLTWLDLAIGVLLVDYLLTALIALYEKKPILLLYGIGFIALRVVDTFLFLYTLPLAFTIKTDGRWVSPRRQVA